MHQIRPRHGHVLEPAMDLGHDRLGAGKARRDKGHVLLEEQLGRRATQSLASATCRARGRKSRWSWGQLEERGWRRRRLGGCGHGRWVSLRATGVVDHGLAQWRHCRKRRELKRPQMVRQDLRSSSDKLDHWQHTWADSWVAVRLSLAIGTNFGLAGPWVAERAMPSLSDGTRLKGDSLEGTDMLAQDQRR